MNAWIDCLTSLDEELNAVHVVSGELVCLILDTAGEFKVRRPEQFQALVECAAFVNWRRLEIGELAILMMAFNA
jgi:hypothetical protein